MAGTNLAKAYVQIIPSADGIKGKITEALGGEASQAGDKAGQVAGSSLVSKIKSIIVTAGIGKVLQSSLMEGADLQQSLGGVRTLFKESADKVIANAQNAYKTAGMSANEYMETVTSFSASLLQGLSGDTNKAVDIADLALKDMADNANKMGTSMESIQNTYQGFAKQNYTMLDNLKLGYGGTATEMARLINDSGVLGDALIDLSDTKGIGEALSEVGFAKMIEAVHVIQERMGITGATAAEAAGTFSGSLASMKAAAKDLLGNLSLGEGVETSLENLLDTAGTFIMDNLFPMVGNIFNGIGTLIQKKGPEMLNNGAKFLTSFVDGISAKLPDLVPKGLEIIASLADTIISNLPTILGAGVNLLGSFVQGIINGLPTLIAEGPRLINDFADAIYSAVGQLLLTGFEMIVSLVQGLWENRGLLLENAGEIFMAFINIFSLSSLFSLGKNLATKLIEGIKKIGPSIFEMGGNIVKFLVSGIKNLALHPVTTLKSLATNAMNTVKGLNWKSIGSDIISGIVNGLKKGVTKIISTAKDVAGAALSAAKKALGIKSPSKIFEDEVGKMIDMGLAAGIKNNVSAVSDSMKELSKATVGIIDTDITLSTVKPSDIKNGTQSNDKKAIVIHNHVEVDGREIARSTAEYLGEQLPWEDL